jgi:hypothetical protein
MTTIAVSRNAGPLGSIHAASPVFINTTIILMIGFAAASALQLIDLRLFNGVNVWEKPAKFFLSLALHAATLGWGVSLLPQAEQDKTGIRRAAWLFAAGATIEMIWIVWYASQGQASHFNRTDPVAMAIYPVMGIVATSLTGITMFVGWRILQQGKNVIAFAAGSGFLLAGTLTTVVAWYMASRTGHAVSGDMTDETGLFFLRWSTTGGDLRPAHFAALHIAQAIPLVAWVWPDRRIVWFSLFVTVVVVAALFWQALAGTPFLSV